MKKLKVVVVDDSAFSRRSIAKMLEQIDEIEVVGYAANGEEGIQKVIALKPDLVTVDLQMPGMDGFTLLRILASRFSLPVIVISALSAADNVFKALELGAFDFVAKPSSGTSSDLQQIQADLQQKVLQLIQHKIGFRKPVIEKVEVPIKTPEFFGKLHHAIDVVAIGSSTGGPPALQNILSAFDKKFPFAMVVSQHMPAGFTRAFADRLNRSSQFDVKEAEDGDAIINGRVLIAPGGYNMVLESSAGQVVARLVAPTSKDRYVPSVDVMLDSCAPLYKKKLMAIILTGMGNDGSQGIRTVKQHGGFVIAESDETAVVYGMPREAVATNLVDRVLPLHKIAREILTKGAFI